MKPSTQQNGSPWVADFLRPLWRQICRQWAVCLLLTISLTGVVALYTYTRNSARFQHRSIQLIMKELGHNLWFIDKSANPFQAATGSPDLPTFPAGRARNLIEDRRIASTYWGNVLQAPVTVNDRTILLTGVEKLDDHQVTEEKDHLLEELKPGAAALGHTLARAWGAREGGELVLEAGRTYRIQTIYPPRSALDDERLWVPLADAQAWLNKPGQANLVLGFLCMSRLSLEEGLIRLEQRIAERHDEWQVLPLRNVLNARALARITTARYLDYLLVSVAAVSVLLMAALGWMEINERKYELAILLAMGAGYPFLFLFFLSKVAVLAIIAALAGFLVGSYASVHWLTPVLVTHTKPVSVLWSDLPGIVGLTLALVGAASIAPLIHLMRLNPTRILAEE